MHTKMTSVSKTSHPNSFHNNSHNSPHNIHLECGNMDSFHAFKRWISISFMIFASTSCSHATNQTAYQSTNSSEIHQGVIRYHEINEASGIIHSAQQNDLFWVLNDSGNQAALYAINGQGVFLGKVNIQGVKNIDWEDIALFHYQGQAYLVIADVGDNAGRRKNLALHFVKEPQLSQLSPTTAFAMKPSWSQTFEYEDGPRDCESLAINSQAMSALLLSKRDKPPRLYQLAIRPAVSVQDAQQNSANYSVQNPDRGHQNSAQAQEPPHIAKYIGKINPLPEQPIVQDLRAIKNLIFARQPTAMDLSADGKKLAVLTYTNAYLYHLSQPYNWIELTSLKPEEIELPYLTQGEALSFDRSGTQLIITTEKLPAPIITLDLTESKRSQ